MIKIVFDGVFLVVLFVTIFLWLLIRIINGWHDFWYNMLKAKAWAKCYTDYPDMWLDRKYGVKYKKHWWNKYKIYVDPDRKYTNDYLINEANDIALKIRKGEIEI